MEELEQAVAEAHGEDLSVVGQLEEILKGICDYAAESGLIENDSVVYRDLFDTKIMGLLTDRPSNVIRRFREDYAQSPQKATDAHYKFSQDTDYIRRYRIARDMKWVAPTEYGDLDITINLSKPGEGSQGHRGGQAGQADRLPQVSAVHRERGLPGAGKPSGPAESPDYSHYHQREPLGLPVFSLRLLQ